MLRTSVTDRVALNGAVRRAALFRRVLGEAFSGAAGDAT
jgi:hypothetical protein